MKKILLSILLLCSLGVSAQDVVVKRGKKEQTSSVDSKRKAEQDAVARKRAEAKRREQARQEQLRKEQEERDRQARFERELQEQARKQREAEEQARLKAEAEAREKTKELERVRPYIDELARNMVYVHGGTFTMGATSEQGKDAESDERPTHSVTLSSFYICKYEVTQDLWEVIMGSNRSWFKGTKKPVEDVSWNDCQTFINKLNWLTGKHYRLPTEAEWEYACRGGNRSKGYKYSGSNSLKDVAWFTKNSKRTTHDVGQKAPNELGLYDMSGNVWELCQDWKGEYPVSSQTNPTGPSISSFRVNRGGCWDCDAGSCRVSNRDSWTPDWRFNLGLRLVLSE